MLSKLAQAKRKKTFLFQIQCHNMSLRKRKIYCKNGKCNKNIINKIYYNLGNNITKFNSILFES